LHGSEVGQICHDRLHAGAIGEGRGTSRKSEDGVRPPKLFDRRVQNPRRPDDEDRCGQNACLGTSAPLAPRRKSRSAPSSAPTTWSR
jgi:hypothetical protein